VNERGYRLGDVAAGLRDVARVAAGGPDVAELMDTALEELKSSLRFSRASYLEVRDGALHMAGSPTADGRDPGTPQIDDIPALHRAFSVGTAVEADEGSLGPLAPCLTDTSGSTSAGTPVLLIPIHRGDVAAGLMVLADPQSAPVDRRTLDIATVYGELLGLGLAAMARAERLEHLRAVLEERNTILREEVSAETDACRAMEASVSRPMRSLVQMAKQVATTDAPVFITGETGTGKEVLARAIHEWSDRADGPFVQVNCAALSDQLIESELFGHVRGAFSGAVTDRPGRFRVADGGTLLLDEIGEMPLEAQTTLLRVLEAGTVVPVGSDHAASVDVRVIAATNVELDLALDRGQFREDLYFRLHVFPLHLPPLRDRVEDIPVLIDQILARMQRRTGHGPWRMTEAAMNKLRRYPWPGNVRELVNALERARVFSPLGGTLPVDVGQHRAERARGRRRRWRTLDDHQRSYIEEVLRHTRGKIYGPGGAAELLNIPPSTLQSRMRRLGVERPKE
jgi:transcriptional regulator with GAF, ATPase, and Fis domain